MQPVSAMRGGCPEVELNACVGDGLELGGSTGAGGGDIDVGEHIKTIYRGKTRGSNRRRVMTEIVLCVWVRVVCRKGKDRGGNRQGD